MICLSPYPRPLGPLSKLLAQGIVPKWAQVANPERLDELIAIEETRDLTQKEEEEMDRLCIPLAPAPKEYDDYVMGPVRALIEKECQARKEETQPSTVEKIVDIPLPPMRLAAAHLRNSRERNGDKIDEDDNERRS